MGKHLDELAKALASGTSRRTALKRFAAGVAGAALANTLFGATAEAGPPGVEAERQNECQKICRAAGATGSEFGTCVSSCTNCLDYGGRPFIVNGGDVYCANGS